LPSHTFSRLEFASEIAANYIVVIIFMYFFRFLRYVDRNTAIMRIIS